MKIAALSDTHGIFPMFPELFDQHIDVLLVAGDIANGGLTHNGHYKSMTKFITWVEGINPTHCVITPGNHDYWEWNNVFAYHHKPKNIHCLIDRAVNVDGLLIHGTPWSLPFMNWNWMKDDDLLQAHWDNILFNTDILINHGPVYGIADHILNKTPVSHYGSKSLLNSLLRKELRYVFTGHIHEAEHLPTVLDNEAKTEVIGVSILNENYEVAYSPYILDL